MGNYNTKTILGQLKTLKFQVTDLNILGKESTHFFVSPAKNDGQIWIMSLSAPVSASSALSHFRFPIDNS